MSWFAELLRRVSSFFHREAIDRELSAEMEFHLEMKTQKYQQQGLNASEARSRHTSNRQRDPASRERSGGLRLGCGGAVHAVRIALRGMTRSTWFTAASVLTLAIGIGSTVS